MRDQAGTLSPRPEKMRVWGIPLSTVEQGPATATSDSGDLLVPSDALKGPAVSPNQASPQSLRGKSDKD